MNNIDQAISNQQNTNLIVDMFHNLKILFQCECIFSALRDQNFCADCKKRIETNQSSSSEQKNIHSTKQKNNQKYQQRQKGKQNCKQKVQKSVVPTTKSLNLKTLFDSSICQSTIKLYNPTIEKFLQSYTANSIEDITAAKMIEFLQTQQKLSITNFNAINSLKQGLMVEFTEKEKKKYLQIKKNIKQCQDQHPHRSWPLGLIQKFINDVVSILNNKIFAFRIYILYYLGARISELEQLTFGMIIRDDFISYIPIKQQKRGQCAKRKFKLPQNVPIKTLEFINLVKIKETSTLNIGRHKKPLESHSFQIDLRRIKSKLKKIYDKQQTVQRDYQQFLQNFMYHDLRYTRMKTMQMIGYSQEKIQQFAQHKKISQTLHYLKNTEDTIVDFNQVVQDTAKSWNYVDSELDLDFSQSKLNK